MDNENMYLEMVTQLKEKFDENELKVERITRNNINLKKNIMVAYSLARIMDEGEFIDVSDYKVFLEMLRGHLSRVIEMDIIRCPCGNVRLPSNIIEVDLNDLANDE